MRLLVREVAMKQGLNLSQLHAAINRTTARSTAMVTLRRYWYATKDGKEQGPPIELVDLVLLNAIARILGVELINLINTAELD